MTRFGSRFRLKMRLRILMSQQIVSSTIPSQAVAVYRWALLWEPTMHSGLQNRGQIRLGCCNPSRQWQIALLSYRNSLVSLVHHNSMSQLHLVFLLLWLVSKACSLISVFDWELDTKTF